MLLDSGTAAGQSRRQLQAGARPTGHGSIGVAGIGDRWDAGWRPVSIFRLGRLGRLILELNDPGKANNVG